MFNQLYKTVSRQAVLFVLYFFVVVTLTYAVLYALDFYPEPISTVTDDESGEVRVVPNESTSGQDESAPVAVTPELHVVSAPLPEDQVTFPARIVIPESDTDVEILNPQSVDMAHLDNALLDGVIRHPQSADFDDRGNMLILGHSSYLPNVFNENFQAFNGIQDLTWGDEIFVYGHEDEKRTYRVDRVYLAKASETVIDNSWGKSKLTLVTCNSFASKDDRYIVEATLVSVS